MNASSARLRIVHPGAMASLQDLGRSGLRRAGVPRAGALQPAWLRLANLLAGNEEYLAAIEFFGGGLQLRADEAPLRVALAGPFSAEILAADGGRRALDGWRSATLAPGEQLRCGMTRGARVAYVAVAGLAAPVLLGSASTYARAGFGSLLAAGDVFSVPPAEGRGERMLAVPPAMAGGAAGTTDGVTDSQPIRIVPGPQADYFDFSGGEKLHMSYDYFDDSALAAFLASTYRVTAESDRMGMRLDGTTLVHRPEKGADIASDATVPGSIQVPGNGKPIVLLNDGQTAGGYPKIATVVSADLPRLAALPAGAAVRFQAVSVAAAEAAARAAESDLKALAGSIVPAVVAGELDLDALYAGNLLSGMVNATRPD